MTDDRVSAEGPWANVTGTVQRASLAFDRACHFRSVVEDDDDEKRGLGPDPYSKARERMRCALALKMSEVITAEVLP